MYVILARNASSEIWRRALEKSTCFALRPTLRARELGEQRTMNAECSTSSRSQAAIKDECGAVF